jgi:hypothetical protein
MRKRLALLSLVFLLGLTYALTLAPGLTWANNGADGGDLISAAATAGVAHPSGYPLYLALAGAFQRLPIRSLAFRTNLMSAVCTLLAAVLLFELLQKETSSLLPPLVGALAFGLSPLLWSQAVISEVYALQALLTVAILYALLSPMRKPSLSLGQGLLLGLALGNHLTTLLLAPLLIVLQPPATEGERDKPFFSRQSRALIGLRFAGVLLGLLVYGILPLRASAGPPVNWGNPVTLGHFWWLVSAQIYRESAFSLSALEILGRFQSWAGFLLHQFTFVGLALGLYGLFSKTSTRLRVSTVWLFASFSLFTITYAYSDSYVYMIPANLAISVWISVGLKDLSVALTKKGYRWGQLLSFMFLAGLLARSVYVFPGLDASRDSRAEDFGAHVLASAPQDALVFTDTDEATFSLWYFHYALRQRQDLRIIAAGLLQFDWYRQTLQHTYPELVIPVSQGSSTPDALVAANPSRAACFADSQGDEVLICDETLFK